MASSSGIDTNVVTFRVGDSIPTDPPAGSVNLDETTGAVYVAGTKELIQVKDPTKLPTDGIAASADKLSTARMINGTEFDGTNNITTSTWGTSRAITIGHKLRNVDGSINVTWTLNDIGAGPGWSTNTTIQSSGWYRISSVSLAGTDGNDNGSLFGGTGIFMIRARRGQSSSYAIFAASAPSSSEDPQVVINQLHFSAGISNSTPPSVLSMSDAEFLADTNAKDYFDKARIVYCPIFESTGGTSGRWRITAHVDVYIHADNTYPATVDCTYIGTSWLMNALTVMDLELSDEEVNSGWKIKEITFNIGGATSAIMRGATDSVSGTSGLVPAPSAGDQDTFLRGDGTWATLPDSPDSTLKWGQF